MEQATKRKLVFVILVVCMVISPITAFANTNNPHNTLYHQMPPARWAQPVEDSWFTRGELPPRQMGLNIYGSVPMVTPSSGVNYFLINERVDNIVSDLISEARRARARSIDFVYEIYTTPAMVSILIHAEISSFISRTYVRSVNFCPHTGRFLTIRDAKHIYFAPGLDILPLANSMLMARMRRSPENYYAAPSISLENQPFIVTDRSITILFDEFQLSSMVSGVYRLELVKSNIRSSIVFPCQLLPTQHAYGLMMVPLRIALQTLGYTTEWNNGRPTVLRNGQEVVWMVPGVNQYHTLDAVRSLEAAPYLYARYNHTYVPVTFFEQILPLSVYYIDSFGKIIILAYLP